MSLKYIIVLMLFIILIGLYAGLSDVDKSSPTVTPGNSSVPKLIGLLENLKPFQVLTCDFDIDKSTKMSFVPSPSDTKMTIWGESELSKAGFSSLSSKFTWKSIPRKIIPAKLSEIVPEALLLNSPELDKTFNNNMTFTHGMIIRIKEDKSKTIYFLSNDMDHPLITSQ